MTPRPLPDAAKTLCDLLAAPPRLVAHLTLVHDVAVDILDAVGETFPLLDIAREAVIFGAATHDLGKVLHPNELTGTGDLHEQDGPALLERHGVPPHVARFARTHGRWKGEQLDGVLVALADALWKGKRAEALEARATALIAGQTGREPWAVFSAVDAVFDEIATRGEKRLVLASIGV